MEVGYTGMMAQNTHTHTHTTAQYRIVASQSRPWLDARVVCMCVSKAPQGTELTIDQLTLTARIIKIYSCDKPLLTQVDSIKVI